MLRKQCQMQDGLQAAPCFGEQASPAGCSTEGSHPWGVGEGPPFLPVTYLLTSSPRWLAIQGQRPWPRALGLVGRRDLGMTLGASHSSGACAQNARQRALPHESPSLKYTTSNNAWTRCLKLNSGLGPCPSLGKPGVRVQATEPAPPWAACEASTCRYTETRVSHETLSLPPSFPPLALGPWSRLTLTCQRSLNRTEVQVKWP